MAGVRLRKFVFPQPPYCARAHQGAPSPSREIRPVQVQTPTPGPGKQAMRLLLCAVLSMTENAIREQPESREQRRRTVRQQPSLFLDHREKKLPT